MGAYLLSETYKVGEVCIYERPLGNIVSLVVPKIRSWFETSVMKQFNLNNTHFRIYGAFLRG